MRTRSESARSTPVSWSLRSAADQRVQVLISADFMYYYAKAVVSGNAMTMPATQV